MTVLYIDLTNELLNSAHILTVYFRNMHFGLICYYKFCGLPMTLFPIDIQITYT